MEMTEEPWELFDLEADLQVTLSEDGKEYLRQFGLEQYDFENYTPDEDPGKYFSDVPLEQNPEALFDLLTRKSLQDQSSSSAHRSSVTAPARQAPPRSSARRATAKLRRHDDGGAGVSHQPATSVSPTYNSIGEDTFPAKTTAAAPGTPNKRVSFSTESAGTSSGRENVGKPPTDGDVEARHPKTVTGFFGRPKVKVGKGGRTTNGADAGKAGAAARRREEEGRNATGSGHAQADPRGSLPKKSRKFKFPVLDLMGRAKRNAGSHSSKQTTATTTTAASATPASKQESLPAPRLREGATAGGGGGGELESPHDHQVLNGLRAPAGGGLDRLDILQGSPTLDAAARGISGFDFGCGSNSGGGRGGEGTSSSGVGGAALSLAESDAHSYISGLSPGARPGNSSRHQPVVPARFRQDSAVTAMGAEGAAVNVVEIVSCRVPEATLPEVAPPLVGGGEHLPPGLLAAVTGDIKLLKESIAHLSLDSLDKLRDTAGNTVLHACASAGHLQCIEYVCTHCPVLVATENKARLTPTAMAIKHGQIEVVDWLLDNMNLRSELSPSHSRRRCLLHHAAKFGQDGCLQLLLSKMEAAGLLLQDLTDQNGNSPAHVAAKYGHLLCLQSLVEYGLDVCAPNQYHHTPCYYADFSSHRACAGYLMVVETCAMLANQHVTQTAHADWLQTRIDAVSVFTTEALTLSGVIARQTSDDVDVTYRLQQTLDDAMDLVGDMAAQLNHLYELTCELQSSMTPADGRHLPSPGKDDLRVSMERATELQRRLEELDAAVGHQRARQHLVKVKDVQRRWEGVMHVPRSLVEQKDIDEQSKKLIRKLFIDAVQRLVIYRTNDHSSRQMAPPSTVAASSHEVAAPAMGCSAPSSSIQREHTDPLRKLSPWAHSELPPPIPSAPRGYTRAAANPAPLRDNSSKLAPSSGGGFNHIESGFGESLNAKLVSELGLTDHLVGGSCAGSRQSPKDGGSVTSNEESEICSVSHGPSPGMKNNVVESFLKSRVFYEQDPALSGSAAKLASRYSKGPTNTLFYSGQTASTRNSPLSSTESPSPGLQLSEFSAFNRVTNRPESKRSAMVPASFGFELITSQEPARRYGHSSFLSGTPSKQAWPGDRSRGDPRKFSYEEGSGHRGSYGDEGQSATAKSCGQEKQTDENSNHHLQAIAAELVSRFKDGATNGGPASQVAGAKSRDVVMAGTKGTDYSEDAISEPTIPPPPQPPPPVPTKPKLTATNSRTSRETATSLDSSMSRDSSSSSSSPHDQASSCDQASSRDEPSPRDQSSAHDQPSARDASASRDQSMTSSSGQSASTADGDTEDDSDLSGLDLGPELGGEDLMLGSVHYLDDEVDGADGGEQYVDDIFSSEELLALAPNGRLPLSMQFETSLSTIEEVSVVGDSTRGDESIADLENEAHTECNSDSDDTVTLPSDQEGNSLGAANPTANVSSSSPIVTTTTSFGDDDRPWYETSDDDDGSHASPTGPRLSRLPERSEHFTLF